MRRASYSSNNGLADPDYTIRRESADIAVSRSPSNVDSIRMQDIKFHHLFYFAKTPRDLLLYALAIGLSFASSGLFGMLFLQLKNVVESDSQRYAAGIEIKGLAELHDQSKKPLEGAGGETQAQSQAETPPKTSFVELEELRGERVRMGVDFDGDIANLDEQLNLKSQSENDGEDGRAASSLLEIAVTSDDPEKDDKSSREVGDSAPAAESTQQTDAGVDETRSKSTPVSGPEKEGENSDAASADPAEGDAETDNTVGLSVTKLGKEMSRLMFDRWTQIALLTLIVGLNTAVSIGFLYCAEIAADIQMGRVKRAYFKAILQQSCGWLDERNELTLPAEISHNCFRIRNATGARLVLACQMFGNFGSALFISFYMDWSLTVLTVSMIVVIYILSKSSMTLRTQQTCVADDAYFAAAQVVEEYLRSLRTIFSLSRGREISDKYAGFSMQATEAFMGMTTVYLAFVQAAQISIFYLIFCVSMSWTRMQLFSFTNSWLVATNLTNAVMVIFYVFSAITSLANALTFLLDYVDFRIGFAEFLSLVSVETRDRELDGTVRLTLTKGEQARYGHLAFVSNRGIREEMQLLKNQQQSVRGSSMANPENPNSAAGGSENLAADNLEIVLRLPNAAFTSATRSTADTLDYRAPQIIAKELFEEQQEELQRLPGDAPGNKSQRDILKQKRGMSCSWIMP